MVNISISIKVALASKGYKNLKQYAHESNQSYDVLVKLCSCSANPTLITIERLAESFDMSVTDFLKLGEGYEHKKLDRA